ncbi:hypothetical protein [Sphingomonas sp.]|uniref:hypothetical protein n=1 Tax=Sphingomonas sp. TaxID=28214 RepID=UPI0025E59AB7|nr:hypothetical protein [Sphingomonas sp.]
MRPAAISWEEWKRILVMIPLLALAACQVSKDEQNGTVTATYNEDVAENAAADVGNFAENVASDVGNEADRIGDKARNVSVEVDTNKTN